MATYPVRLDPFQNPVNVSWGDGGRYFILGGFQYNSMGAAIDAPVLAIRDDGVTSTYAGAQVPTVRIDAIGNPAIDGDDSVTHRYLGATIAFSSSRSPQQFDRAGDLYVTDGSFNIFKLAKSTGAVLGSGVSVPNSLLGFDVYQGNWFYTLTFESSQTVIRRLSFNPADTGWTTRISGLVPVGGGGANAMAVDASGNVWLGLVDGSNNSFVNKYDGASGALLFSKTIPPADSYVITWNFNGTTLTWFQVRTDSFSPGLVSVDSDGANGIAVTVTGGANGVIGNSHVPDQPPSLDPPKLSSYGPTGALNWTIQITPPAPSSINGPTSVAAVKNAIAVVGVWDVPAFFAGLYRQQSFATGYSTKTGAQLWTKTALTGPPGTFPSPYVGTLPGEYDAIFRSPH